MLAPTPQPSAGLPAPLPVPKFHDVTISTKKSYACARVMGVPPEEFGIGRHARTIKDTGYLFHEVSRTQADLIAEGYDAEQIKKLPSHVISDKQESQSRDTVDEGRSGQGDEGLNESNRMILVTEHYVRMDYEDNGKPALYQVVTGGTQGDILKRDGKEAIEEVDECPFAAMTPVIVTHRFFGRSIADLVMDIQRIKTALLRGALDNLYLHNNPRVEVAEAFANESTIDDLLVSRPGGIIRTKQPGGLNWQVVPDITGSVYPALQYFDAVREWRTGVSRQGQGVDPNALQNQVATIANQMADAAQAKTKLIARIFAETGIKDMFQLLHGLIRKNGQQAETVRLRNKWVSVDPRDWKERNDLTVNVGLGTGSKQAQQVAAKELMMAQKELTPIGLVSKKNVYESVKEFTKLLGHKDTDRFWTAPGQQQQGQPGQPPDPDSQPIPPPQDPKMAELQAKNEIEKTQAQADIATQDRKTQAEIAQNDRKAQQESQQSREQHLMKMEEMRVAAEIKQREHHMNVASMAIKAATTTTKTGEDGTTQSSVDHALIDNVLSKLHPPAQPQHRGMRIVRDQHGRVSHTEPME